LCLAIILFTSAHSFSKDIPKPKYSDEERRDLPINLDYYQSHHENFPILAEIIPINENGRQTGKKITGFIFPTSMAPSYYPYYSMLCMKEVKSGEKSFEDIVMLEEVYLIR
jgi:hypothetical protein